MNTSISSITPQSYASNNFKGIKPRKEKFLEFLDKIAEPKAPLIEGMSEIESKYYQKSVNFENKLKKLKEIFVGRFIMKVN